jgi:hypothetical protein
MFDPALSEVLANAGAVDLGRFGAWGSFGAGRRRFWDGAGGSAEALSLVVVVGRLEAIWAAADGWFSGAAYCGRGNTTQRVWSRDRNSLDHMPADAVPLINSRFKSSRAECPPSAMGKRKKSSRKPAPARQKIPLGESKSPYCLMFILLPP